MREFRDPITAMAAAGVVVTATGQVLDGVAAKQEADASAKQMKLNQRIQSSNVERALRDERLENKRTLARSRARLSAGGATLGTVASIDTAIGTESQLRQSRLRAGDKIDRATTAARAKNTRAAGRRALTGSILSAGGTALSGGAKVGSMQGSP